MIFSKNSNLGQIGPLTLGLSSLEHLKIPSRTCYGENGVSNIS